jgi:hypothetical protein
MVILLIWQAEELDDIQRMRNTPDFFNKLVDSIAPTVFGHQDIKRAILLMLLGGVHKLTHEGINLRGDINVCIVGDPSCAKSQFLKYATISGFVRFNYCSLYKFNHLHMLVYEFKVYCRHSSKICLHIWKILLGGWVDCNCGQRTRNR